MDARTTAKTPNELVEMLTAWLHDEVWPDLTGYAHGMPEPANDRSVDRTPFFVVTASAGTYGYGVASTTIIIGVQVESDAKDTMRTYAWACQRLRDKIYQLGQALYRAPVGLVFGCRPHELTWSIPTAQPRPQWQAQITIPFDLPGMAPDNGEFLN